MFLHSVRLHGLLPLDVLFSTFRISMMVFKLFVIRFISTERFTLSTKSYMESCSGRFWIALIALITLMIDVSDIFVAVSLQID